MSETIYYHEILVLLNRFLTLHGKSPALQILVPDRELYRFVEWHKNPNNALHLSMILCALQNECLEQFTYPIERFIVDQNVEPKYKNSLIENWMHYTCANERHHKSKIFSGKIVELMLAACMEKSGWKIVNLEAYGCKSDIEASIDGNLTHLEVKYFGIGKVDFKCLVASISGNSYAVWANPYEFANYILFRICQAGRQLKDITSRTIVSLVVEEQAWSLFNTALNFIKWEEPIYFKDINDWDKFANEQKQTPEEMLSFLSNIDEIMIFTKNGTHLIQHKKDIPLYRLYQ